MLFALLHKQVSILFLVRICVGMKLLQHLPFACVSVGVVRVICFGVQDSNQHLQYQSMGTSTQIVHALLCHMQHSFVADASLLLLTAM